MDQTFLSVQYLFEVVASVLHLGNIQFSTDGKGHALLNNSAGLHLISNVREKEKEISSY